ncbi:MAG: hypothetical protein RLZZ176_53 [Cyanobacteriota bacterium]
MLKSYCNSKIAQNGKIVNNTEIFQSVLSVETEQNPGVKCVNFGVDKTGAKSRQLKVNVLKTICDTFNLTDNCYKYRIIKLRN